MAHYGLELVQAALAAHPYCNASVELPFHFPWDSKISISFRTV